MSNSHTHGSKCSGGAVVVVVQRDTSGSLLFFFFFGLFFLPSPLPRNTREKGVEAIEWKRTLRPPPYIRIKTASFSPSSKGRTEKRRPLNITRGVTLPIKKKREMRVARPKRARCFLLLLREEEEEEKKRSKGSKSGAIFDDGNPRRVRSSLLFYQHHFLSLFLLLPSLYVYVLGLPHFMHPSHIFITADYTLLLLLLLLPLSSVQNFLCVCVSHTVVVVVVVAHRSVARHFPKRKKKEENGPFFLSCFNSKAKRTLSLFSFYGFCCAAQVCRRFSCNKGRAWVVPPFDWVEKESWTRIKWGY